jgi:hypothetical protein
MHHSSFYADFIHFHVYLMQFYGNLAILCPIHIFLCRFYVEYQNFMLISSKIIICNFDAQYHSMQFYSVYACKCYAFFALGNVGISLVTVASPNSLLKLSPFLLLSSRIMSFISPIQFGSSCCLFSGWLLEQLRLSHCDDGIGRILPGQEPAAARCSQSVPGSGLLVVTVSFRLGVQCSQGSSLRLAVTQVTVPVQ